ncbi:Uu.00g111120.m01.CDS01 [Anthostomella pinea]|uniref:Uu.00g111120.m01.CDS01 n=1 Tax=Anthostomella pinea TaxID=933095 RepID=A0AAI8YGB4_9PEZI|nr:Uu.00g111120.m01.CDS01 [Anthostomella pinea]
MASPTKGAWSLETYEALKAAFFANLGPFSKEQQQAIIDELKAQGIVTTGY